MMDLGIYGVVLLTLVLIYEKVWRKRICIRKINDKIYLMGGEVFSIEKLSLREEIYHVGYLLKDEKKATTVKFSLFYHEIWY